MEGDLPSDQGSLKLVSNLTPLQGFFFKDRNGDSLILNVKSNTVLIFRHLPSVSVNYSGY